MRKQIGVLLALCVMVLFTSCLTTKQTNLLREPGGSIPSYPEAEAIGEYTIKPGDELRVQVTFPNNEKYARTAAQFRLFTSNYTSTSNESNKLRSFSVSPEGYIKFPYLGDYYVVGKTTLELRQLFEREINTKIIEDGACLVNVTLDNRYFSVIGESGVGRYPIEKEQLTIFQALSKSRDIRTYGNRAKVRIVRQTETGSMVEMFDVRSADIINSEFYYIQPNDVIYIEPLKRQFWGINSFGSIFAVITSIVSLGTVAYKLIEGK